VRDVRSRTADKQRPTHDIHLDFCVFDSRAIGTEPLSRGRTVINQGSPEDGEQGVYSAHLLILMLNDRGAKVNRNIAGSRAGRAFQGTQCISYIQISPTDLFLHPITHVEFELAETILTTPTVGLPLIGWMVPKK